MSTINIIRQIKAVAQRIERNGAKRATAMDKIEKATKELRKLYASIPNKDKALYEEQLSKYRDYIN